MEIGHNQYTPSTSWGGLIARTSRHFRWSCVYYWPNRPISRIPECIRHISHNAPFCNSVTKWCIAGYGTDASWDLWDGSIAITTSTHLIIVSLCTLRWRRNGHGDVSNHQPHHCLLNLLFGCRSKKTSKLRVTGLCAWNSPGTGEFSAQRASNAENNSIWWRHHVRHGASNQRHINSLLPTLHF